MMGLREEQCGREPSLRRLRVRLYGAVRSKLGKLVLRAALLLTTCVPAVCYADPGITWDQAKAAAPKPICDPQTLLCTGTPWILWAWGNELFYTDPDSAIRDQTTGRYPGETVPMFCSAIGGQYQGPAQVPGVAGFIKGVPYYAYWGNCGATQYANPDYRGLANIAPKCWLGDPPVVGQLPNGSPNSTSPNFGDCASPMVESSPPDSPPPCNCGEFEAGNPIYPLRGVKRETVGTGWRIGAIELKFTYDNTRSLSLGTNEPPATNANPTVLGPLWTSNLHRRLISQKAPGTTDPRAVLVSRGDGYTTNFSSNGSSSLFASATADITDRLGIVNYTYWYLDAQNRSEEFYGSGSAHSAANSENLASITWASGDRVVFTYSDSSTPTSAAPAPGYLLRAQDNKGRALQFSYDAAGHLRQVINAAGQQLLLDYDTLGNLSKLKWPDGTFRTYLYENASLPWALTGINDELGIRKATFGYDGAGRAISTENAGGVNRYAVSYSTPPEIRAGFVYDSARSIYVRSYPWIAPAGITVERPTGPSVALNTQLLNGKIYLTGQSQPAGSGSTATVSSQSFDVNGNLNLRDDFNGTRTCYANDLTRNLETARVEGLSNTASCSPYLTLGGTLPAGSRKVSTAWHPDWKLEARRAEPGKLTTSIYNGQPDPFNGNAIASCAPSTALLPDGKPIAVLCKQVEQATSDVNGSRGADLAGIPASTADPSYGNVVLLLHMDDATAGTFTDSSGQNKVPSNVVAPITTDTANARYGAASGNFTGGYLWYADSPDFDMGGGDFTIETWIKFNSAAMGTRVFAFGKSASNGGGGTVTLAKGGDNKLAFYWTTTAGSSSLIDSAAVSPNTWYHVAMVRSGGTMTLWKNGVSIGSAAVSGSFIPNTNHFAVGAVGEYTSAYDTKMLGWLDEFRITKGVARYTSAFTAPSGIFGGATSVTGVPSAMDASVPNRVRSWTYNAVGQVLTAKDPLNNLTTYAYYGDTTADHTLGDLQTVTNAKNQVTSYGKYNKHGQLLESTDPNGVVTTNTYDLRQRLLSTSIGGQTTSYAYDAAGQLLKVTSPDTNWIGYEYDAAHRQTAVKDNLGNRIEYVLDNAGNKTSQSVKDPGGNLARSLARSIDALGRTQQTTGRE
jgi:YD repeat-containing protein